MVQVAMDKAPNVLEERFAEVDPSVEKTKPFYSILVGAFAGVGGFAFGFDLGVISSVLVMPYFVHYFAGPTATSIPAFDKTWIVNFLTLGCAIGALGQGLIADWIGRKWAIEFGAILFVIGGAIQTAATNLAMMYVGRVVAGLAVGLLSVVCPMFMAETIEGKFRGRMVTFQQLSIVSGISFAFWLDYACNLHREELQDWSWRAPLLVQPIAGALIMFGCFFIPKSPRWLFKVGREDEALKSLAFLRGVPAENAYVQIEFDEIKKAVALEREIGNSSYRELLQPGVRKRLGLVLGINLFQQLSGTNVINFYAPTFYQVLVGNDSNFVLLLQGFYGVLKLIMTVPTFFVVDRFGRRILLLVGSVVMGAAMFSVATVFAVTTGGNPANTAQLKSQFGVGLFGVISIWLFVVGFNASWGPITWVFTSEVFPLRVRAKGMSMGGGMQWLSQFVIASIAPSVFAVNTFALFYLLGAVCIVQFFWIYFLLPETKGISLEEMDELFGSMENKDAVATADTKA